MGQIYSARRPARACRHGPGAATDASLLCGLSVSRVDRTISSNTTLKARTLFVSPDGRLIIHAPATPLRSFSGSAATNRTHVVVGAAKSNRGSITATSGNALTDRGDHALLGQVDSRSVRASLNIGGTWKAVAWTNARARSSSIKPFFIEGD